jgi:hypothetical protein
MFRVLCLGLGVLFAVACGEDRPGFLGSGPGVVKPEPDGGFVLPPPGPPPPDAAGLCGDEVVPLATEQVNFYFVLDASGSMEAEMEGPAGAGGPGTRYQAARSAIVDLLLAVGHRISYGAALFPARSNDADDVCPAGEEVFSTRPGDRTSFAVTGEAGPTLQGFDRTLAARSPSGLTPTAATLEGLHDAIVALPGKTFVFLLTDGAPNCNAAVPCGTDACIPNIEGACSPEVNCCDPRSGVADVLHCLDAEPTVLGVRRLAEAGVPTYVVGMPGTTTFSDLLDRLAVEGLTARPTSPRYFPVQTSGELTDTLREIGLSAALVCDVTLTAAPPDSSLVNVFADDEVLSFGTEWVWTSDSTLRVEGTRCDELRDGVFQQLRVVAGCPSEIR